MTLTEASSDAEPTASGSLAPVIRACLIQRIDRCLDDHPSITLKSSVLELRRALQSHQIEAALRVLDRAWRALPADATALAPLYGLLLSLGGRDFDAALRLLQRAIADAPDPGIAALIALALVRLRRSIDAQQQIETALAEYCVEPGGLLAQVAARLVAHAEIDASIGWVGRGPNLEIVGEIFGATRTGLAIALDGQPSFTQLVPDADQAGGRPFRIEPPRGHLPFRIDAQCKGLPLLGSGRSTPSDFGLDGRSNCRGTRVTGWARLGWLPARRPNLRLEDENHCSRLFQPETKPGFDGRWPFEFDLRGCGLKGARLEISAQLPDGRWQPLPDSPLLLRRAALLDIGKPLRLPAWRPRASHTRRPRALSQNERPVDVIIPVYRNRQESLACIDSALASTDASARVIVVDDASDDTELTSALDALAAAHRIQLLKNSANQGYAASVNQALALHPRHDAVLLNSDTLVFDDWLSRLRAAAYSHASVGTVTPFSNNGTIASYPDPGGGAVDPEDAPGLHALAGATHSGIRAPIPVGVGFCLYIRRDCLDEVGPLDAAVYGKGYGEETDFCLRAGRRGWSHQLAADVFVYHASGRSFGARRGALLDRARRLTNLRHPGYDRFIESFLAQDPLQTVRRRLDERRLRAFQGRFVLLLTLSLPGGVDRFVADRCRILRSQGLYPLLLRPAKAGNARRCELWTDALELHNLQFDIPAELSELSQLLASLALHSIELQHFLHLDARVIEAVRALEVPYRIHIHDYAWICPRVSLIGDSGRYCGEPAVTVCHACVRRNGSNLGESISADQLRARSNRWLRNAQRVIAPSSDTAERIRRHFPQLEVDVEPHPDRSRPIDLPPRGNRAGIARVAIIGAIGDHKGYRILSSCARDARRRQLPLEFVVIGYTQDDPPLLRTGNVFITGRYGEAEAPHLMVRERPDVAWFPSVAPETWCYTLDIAFAAGLPILAFDLGAIAERLREAGTGLLLPLSSSARDINERLLELAARPQDKGALLVRSVQSPPAQARYDVKMSAAMSGEKRMVESKSNATAAQPTHQDALSASVQVLPLPAGLYLFSVKAASPVPAREAAQISLPAVHIGLGPGVRSDEVEFIAGPTTHGAWLFAPGDLLVTKVNGQGATLILSSLRAPGGEVLSIKVERLESRADADPAARTNGAAVAAVPASSSAQKRQGKAEDTSARQSVFRAGAKNLPLPIQIATHIRTRGDMKFVNEPWAGRVAPGLWIESFSVRPLEQFGAQDIEYKALTGSGFETPWLSDDKMCGTKGMATPLVGFAVRLKPTSAPAGYDCEYSGYFQSGVAIGPLRNGAPCRSTTANDPLEGIQVRLVKRVAAARAAIAPSNGASPKVSRTPNASKTHGKSRAALKSVERRAPATRSAAGKRSGRSGPARRS